MSPIGLSISSGGLGLRHGPRLAGGGGFDADAATLIAAMTTPPDATRQALINSTIIALKTAGIWDELDECWFMAAATEQAGLLGWKRYKDLLAVNAPTFTADQGFAGNGTTSYLNTQFVPSTHGVQYALNDASFGVYSRTNSSAATRDMAAFGPGGSNVTSLAMKWSDNKQYSVVSSTLGVASVIAANSLGLGVSRRTTSSNIQSYRNGSEIAVATSAAQGRITVSLYIGALNNNGTAEAFSTRQYAFAFVGAAMTPTQQLALFTAVENYLDEIGAGVVA